MKKGMIVALGVLATSCTIAANVPMRPVSGNLEIHDGMALPDDTAVVIEVRRPDGALLASGESRTDGRQPPLPFQILVPAGQAGTLTASIQPPDMPAWESGGIALSGGEEAVALGSLLLEQGVDAPPAETAAPAPAPLQVSAAQDDPAQETPATEAPDPEEVEVAAAGPTEGAGVAEETDGFEPAAATIGQSEATQAGPMRYRCGEDVLLVALDDRVATVSVGGIDVPMASVPSASGARYEASGDPETYYWSRGDRALISLAGVVLPECEQVGRVR